MTINLPARLARQMGYGHTGAHAGEGAPLGVVCLAYLRGARARAQGPTAAAGADAAVSLYMRNAQLWQLVCPERFICVCHAMCM